jgi:hypothetical protein
MLLKYIGSGIAVWTALTAYSTSAATVTFSNASLPNTEDGLTIANLPGTSPAVIDSLSGNYHLVAGTNVTPIKIRVSSSRPFNFVSLDILQAFRTWRLESSAGAVAPLPNQSPKPATFNLDGVAGWNNLTYFDINHDPGEANGGIRVDNIVFNWTPDFDGDSVVGSADLGLWKTNFGASAASPSMGDADGSGIVDGNDFLIWQRHVGSPHSQIAAPEPAAMTLLAFAAALAPVALRQFAVGERER